MDRIAVSPVFVASRPAPRGGLLSRISTWMRVAEERRALANLPADRLKDIGMSEHAAAMEIARPFWDAPSRG